MSLRFLMKTNEAMVVMQKNNMGRILAGRLVGREIVVAVEAKKMSKDEYIAKLEAELQSF